jgi:putative aldouronate transport system permease protein
MNGNEPATGGTPRLTPTVKISSARKLRRSRDRNGTFVLLNHEQRRQIRHNWTLYLMLLPVLLYFIVFHYVPMYGLQIAFKDFQVANGIAGSPWVGLKHFRRFVESFWFTEVIRNTFVLSLYGLVASFPVPIVLALVLHYNPSSGFRRTVQTIVYAPNFISTVVVVSMMVIFLSPSGGIVNRFIGAFGGQPVAFFARPGWFPHLYVMSEIWQRAGFSAIIYLGVLSSVDPTLHESATIDGATKRQRMWYVDIPHIIPTAVVLFILAFGRLVAIGFEKTFLMQTPLNLETSEIIATYIYKVGLATAGSGRQYSFGTAVGLLQSVANLVLILTVNRAAKRISGQGLF